MLAMLEDLLIVQYRCGKTQTKSFLSYFSFQENSVSLQTVPGKVYILGFKRRWEFGFTGGDDGGDTWRSPNSAKKASCCKAQMPSSGFTDVPVMPCWANTTDLSYGSPGHWSTPGALWLHIGKKSRDQMGRVRWIPINRDFKTFSVHFWFICLLILNCADRVVVS